MRSTWTTMDKLRWNLLFPYIQHLSLANRHNVSKQIFALGDKEFDNTMDMLRKNELSFSDF